MIGNSTSKSWPDLLFRTVFFNINKRFSLLLSWTIQYWFFLRHQSTLWAGTLTRLVKIFDIFRIVAHSLIHYLSIRKIFLVLLFRFTLLSLDVIVQLRPEFSPLWSYIGSPSIHVRFGVRVEFESTSLSFKLIFPNLHHWIIFLRVTKQIFFLASNLGWTFRHTDYIRHFRGGSWWFVWQINSRNIWSQDACRNLAGTFNHFYHTSLTIFGTSLHIPLEHFSLAFSCLQF